jgi:hypothetical protein
MLARDDVAYDRCLDVVAAATEAVRQWRPGTDSMRDVVCRAFDAAAVCPDVVRWSTQAALGRVAALAEGRADFQPIDDFDERWNGRIGPESIPFDRPMKNYLAARVFGNWIAYQGRGLRTVVEWLRTCAAIVRHDILRRVIAGDPLEERVFVEAVRSADLLLLHVLDGAAFGKHVAPIEGPGPA